MSKVYDRRKKVFRHSLDVYDGETLMYFRDRMDEIISYFQYCECDPNDVVVDITGDYDDPPIYVIVVSREETDEEYNKRIEIYERTQATRKRNKK